MIKIFDELSFNRAVKAINLLGSKNTNLLFTQNSFQIICTKEDVIDKDCLNRFYAIWLKIVRQIK